MFEDDFLEGGLGLPNHGAQPAWPQAAPTGLTPGLSHLTCTTPSQGSSSLLPGSPRGGSCRTRDLGLKSEGVFQTGLSPEGEKCSAAGGGRGCTPKLIRSNKALMCLKLGRECRQGPQLGLVAGRHPPERPLSPPQGQRWPPWAPQPSAPAAAGAPHHQHQRRCPGPRHHPPAAGSGTGLGAVGVKAPPPARPLPPTQSAHPVPWLGPCLPPSPCQGTPASTALHLCLCRHLLLPQRPLPAPAPRLCAGPVAGTSSATCPAFLSSCSSHQWRPPPRKHALGPRPPVLASPSWGEGPAPLSAVFLLARMGDMNLPPKQQKTQNRQLFICF